MTSTFWGCRVFSLLQRLSVLSAQSKVVVNLQRMPKLGSLIVLPKGQKVFAVSEALKDNISKSIFGSTFDVKVIGNPIATDEFYSTEFDRQCRPRRVAFAGRIHPEKGVDYLIESFVASGISERGWELYLFGPISTEAGGGGDEYFAKLEKLSEGQSVKFRGEIKNPSELARELRQCEIFVYPSLAENGETFGVAPLEAMACGCATIVSDLSCFSGFAQDRANCLRFDHRVNGIENLTRKLFQLADNEGLRRTLTQNAVHAAQEFNELAIAKQYSAAVSEIVNE